jgi:hypothetical protein
MIPRSKVKLVYETDRWDGPTAGVAKVNGKHLYFLLRDEYYRRRWWSFLTSLIGIDVDGQDRVRVRIFGLYDPPPEVWKTIDERHADFIKYVGSHCEYDETGKRTGTQNDDRDQHRLFFDKWTPENRVKMKEEWRVESYTEV